jgi:hypothetical protein
MNCFVIFVFRFYEKKESFINKKNSHPTYLTSGYSMHNLIFSLIMFDPYTLLHELK